MSSLNEHIECCFDAFCKRLLKNENIDAIREQERLDQCEVNFSGLTAKEREQLHYIDTYAPERRMFDLLGVEVEITNGDLVRALVQLSNEQRTIILLYYLLDLPDAEIAGLLNLPRYAVQRRRTSAIKQLQKTMEGCDHEENH